MHLRPEDKILIAEVVARYNHAIDSHDVVEWLGTWTDYATLYMPDAKVEGKEALRAWFGKYVEKAGAKRHLTYNLFTDGDTDSAKAQCDLLILSIGEVPQFYSSGCFDDRLTRIGENWRFASRRLVYDAAELALLDTA